MTAAAFNFTRKTLPPKEGLGEKLTKRRIALGYDIKDIEKSIRIRAKYIEAIESGNYDKLPPDVYVKGFIKNYASFLKLDENKVLKAYQRERGIVESVKKANSKAPVVKPIDTPKLIITPRTIVIGSISLLASIILIYIFWQVRILTAPPKLTLVSPQDNINVDADSLYVEGKTDAGANLFINEVAVGVGEEGVFKEKISLQNGVNILKIRSENRLGKKSEVTRTIVANIKETATQANGQIELKLTVGPTTASLLVEVDGKKLTDKPIVVLAGVTQVYRANEKISVTTNNGGSVKAIYNGQDIGAFGKDNEQIKRDFVKGMQVQ